MSGPTELPPEGLKALEAWLNATADSSQLSGRLGARLVVRQKGSGEQYLTYDSLTLSERNLFLSGQGGANFKNIVHYTASLLDQMGSSLAQKLYQKIITYNTEHPELEQIDQPTINRIALLFQSTQTRAHSRPEAEHVVPGLSSSPHSSSTRTVLEPSTSTSAASRDSRESPGRESPSAFPPAIAAATSGVDSRATPEPAAASGEEFDFVPTANDGEVFIVDDEESEVAVQAAPAPAAPARAVAAGAASREEPDFVVAASDDQVVIVDDDETEVAEQAAPASSAQAAAASGQESRAPVLSESETALATWVRRGKESKKRPVIRDGKIVFAKLTFNESRQKRNAEGPASIKEIMKFCVEKGIAVSGLSTLIEQYNAAHEREKSKQIDENTLGTIRVLEAFKTEDRATRRTLLRGADSSHLKIPLTLALRSGSIDTITALVNKLRHMDESGALKDLITYEDIKAVPRAQLKNALLALKGTEAVGSIVKGALKYRDHALLRLLQQEGITDDCGNTALHLICHEEQTSFHAGIAGRLIGICTPEQLSVRNDQQKTPLELACYLGHTSIAQALMQTRINLFEVNQGNNPLEQICAIRSENTSAAKVTIAGELIAKATKDQLNVVRRNNKTVLDLASDNQHEPLVHAILERLLESLQGNELSTLWERAIIRNNFSPEAVTRIVQGFARLIPTSRPLQAPFDTLQAIVSRYNAIKDSGITPIDALRSAFFLERHLPAHATSPITLNLTDFKRDLHLYPLSEGAMQLILNTCNSRSIANPTFPAIQDRLAAIRQNVTVQSLPTRQALLTAIILAHDVPRIAAASQSIFQGEGIVTLSGDATLPEGWQIFKRNHKISVITPHILGEGSFKRAVTTVQTLFDQHAVAQASQFTVYLKPKDANASPDDLANFEHEMDILTALGDSPYIVSAVPVSHENQLPRVGRLDEPGEDLSVALRTQKGKTPAQVAERLAVFEDLMQGVSHMHSRNIIHGDLKLPNCLLINGRGKLTDFGTSARVVPQVDRLAPASRDKIAILPYSFTQNSYGSPAYTSPEVRPPARVALNENLTRTDIWACGLMLKELYDGEQFGWVEQAGEMSGPALEAAVKKELAPILLALARKKATNTLTPEEQAKYQVYQVIAGLLGVRINVPHVTGSQETITPAPTNGQDFSVRPEDRLSAAEAVTAVQGAIRAIQALTRAPAVTVAAASAVS